MKFPGTDKDHPHGYLPDYERIAAALGPAAVVCEVGVWHGGSLAMWQELFPQGTVIGVDTDPASTWPAGTHRVVIRQEDPRLREAVTVFAPGGLDLVVDDASHVAELTEATFLSLWPLVKAGGYYVVEDWTTALGLAEWCPWLISAVYEGADAVTFTSQGLIIVRRALWVSWTLSFGSSAWLAS